MGIEKTNKRLIMKFQEFIDLFDKFTLIAYPTKTTEMIIRTTASRYHEDVINRITLTTWITEPMLQVDYESGNVQLYILCDISEWCFSKDHFIVIKHLNKFNNPAELHFRLFAENNIVTNLVTKSKLLKFQLTGKI